MLRRRRPLRFARRLRRPGSRSRRHLQQREWLRSMLPRPQGRSRPSRPIRLLRNRRRRRLRGRPLHRRLDPHLRSLPSQRLLPSRPRKAACCRTGSRAQRGRLAAHQGWRASRSFSRESTVRSGVWCDGRAESANAGSWHDSGTSPTLIYVPCAPEIGSRFEVCDRLPNGMLTPRYLD